MSYLLLISAPDFNPEKSQNDKAAYGPEGTVQTIKVFDTVEQAHAYATLYAARNSALTPADTPNIAFHFAPVEDGVLSINVSTGRRVRPDPPEPKVG